MRRAVLLSLVLILSLTLASAAFAGQVSYVVQGNAQSGSVSDGIHGFSWYHENTDWSVNSDGKYRKGHLLHGNILSYSKYDQGKIAKLERILHRYGQSYRQQHWNYNRHLEKYFCVDDNGVSHYFSLDPDRTYEVHQYKDKNGTTQFRFEATGWK